MSDVTTRVVPDLCFAQRGMAYPKAMKQLSPEGFEKVSLHLNSPLKTWNPGVQVESRPLVVRRLLN